MLYVDGSGTFSFSGCHLFCFTAALLVLYIILELWINYYIFSPRTNTRELPVEVAVEVSIPIPLDTTAVTHSNNDVIYMGTFTPPLPLVVSNPPSYCLYDTHRDMYEGETKC